jgi:phosphoenolpyruvate carboxykinase (ATP)
MVRAVLSGALRSAPTEVDPIFGLTIPTHVEDVPPEVLNPRKTWPDSAQYDEQARKVAEMFRKNFEKFGDVNPAIKAAGPK